MVWFAANINEKAETPNLNYRNGVLLLKTITSIV
jgi:hypothetical protein